MLQRLKYILLILGTAAAATACSDDIDAPDAGLQPGAPGTVTITFRSSGMSRSANSDASESLIDNALVCLYRLDATDTDAPVVAERYTGLAAQDEATVTMQLTDEIVQTLFANTGGAKCRVFAVANITDEQYANLGDERSISALKNIEIESDFNTRAEQTSFVMTGPGDLTYKAPAVGEVRGSASGTITLYRAAAKIVLTLDIPAEIEVQKGEVKETWEPQYANLRVLLNHGVLKSISAPEEVDGKPWTPASLDAYYSSTLQQGRLFVAVDDTLRTVTSPFYTYPTAWSESIFETNKTTMTLMVPWRKKGEESWNMYYYQVPVTPATLTHIARNHAYNVKLHVGMLGSLVPDTPQTVEASYEVVAWGQNDLDVDLKDFRYLVVSPNSIDIQNENEITIPFYTSHPVEITTVDLTFQRFNFYSNGNGEVVNITVGKDVLQRSSTTTNGTTYKYCDWKVSDLNGQMTLTLSHPLEIWTPYDKYNNVVTFTGKANNVAPASVQSSIQRFQRPANPEPSYSYYTIKLHLQHKDNSAYSEDVTFTQYPAMYIEAIPNPGKGTNGNVYVNGGNNTSSGLGGVHGLTGTNTNPNMYLITISQLESGSPYIIGDPRSEYINNLNATSNDALAIATVDNTDVADKWCNIATALYMKGDGTTRRLSYYYPTIEGTADQYAMKVAPKFRIASSYGVTNEITRNNARRRVATYQEEGCPAGRWRLPTKGELQFIVKLSSTGKIPYLFTRGSRYWTAQGLFTVDNNNNGTITTSSNTTGFVKGVYDEWYWDYYTNSKYNITPNNNGAYLYRLGDIPRGVPNE